MTPASRELLIGLEDGSLPEADFETRFAALLGVAPENLILRMFAGAVSRRHGAGGAPRPRGRRAHRADLQLLGNLAL